MVEVIPAHSQGHAIVHELRKTSPGEGIVTSRTILISWESAGFTTAMRSVIEPE